MKKVILFICLGAMGLTFNSCSTSQKIKSGKYAIVSLKGQQVKSKDNEMFIKIDLKKQKISGRTSCNNFFGSFKVSKHKIKMGPLGATKKYCKGKMKVEQKLFEQLAQVKQFSFAGKQLLFQSKKGKTLITLKKKQ